MSCKCNYKLVKKSQKTHSCVNTCRYNRQTREASFATRFDLLKGLIKYVTSFGMPSLKQISCNTFNQNCASYCTCKIIQSLKFVT